MTFKEMTFGEKVDHIWEYYKLHILGAAGALLFIGSMLNLYVFNPAPKVVFDLTVRVPQHSYDSDYGLTLRDELIDHILDDPKTQTITVDLLQTNISADPQLVMAVETRFMGKAEVRELDLIIVDEMNFKFMAADGYFMEIGQLEEQYGIMLPEDAKIYVTDPESQDKRFMALDITKVPKLAPIVTDRDTNYYVGVFVRSLQGERTMEVLAYLTE